MTFREVKELNEMGFTPEQITQLNLSTEPQPEPQPGTKPEPQPGTKPEPQPGTKPDPQPGTKPDPQPETKPDPQPEPDPVSQKLESMEKKINDFIVAMQKNNLKTASVNILPDDQIDVNANAALSELIRPTIKKED